MPPRKQPRKSAPQPASAQEAAGEELMPTSFSPPARAEAGIVAVGPGFASSADADSVRPSPSPSPPSSALSTPRRSSRRLRPDAEAAQPLRAEESRSDEAERAEQPDDDGESMPLSSRRRVRQHVLRPDLPSRNEQGKASMERVSRRPRQLPGAQWKGEQEQAEELNGLPLHPPPDDDVLLVDPPQPPHAAAAAAEVEEDEQQDDSTAMQTQPQSHWQQPQEQKRRHDQQEADNAHEEERKDSRQYAQLGEDEPDVAPSASKKRGSRGGGSSTQRRKSAVVTRRRTATTANPRRSGEQRAAAAAQQQATQRTLTGMLLLPPSASDLEQAGMEEADGSLVEDEAKAAPPAADEDDGSVIEVAAWEEKQPPPQAEADGSSYERDTSDSSTTPTDPEQKQAAADDDSFRQRRAASPAEQTDDTEAVTEQRLQPADDDASFISSSSSSVEAEPVAVAAEAVDNDAAIAEALSAPERRRRARGGGVREVAMLLSDNGPRLQADGGRRRQRRDNTQDVDVEAASESVALVHLLPSAVSAARSTRRQRSSGGEPVAVQVEAEEKTADAAAEETARKRPRRAAVINAEVQRVADSKTGSSKSKSRPPKAGPPPPPPPMLDEDRQQRLKQLLIQQPHIPLSLAQASVVYHLHLPTCQQLTAAAASSSSSSSSVKPAPCKLAHPNCLHTLGYGRRGIWASSPPHIALLGIDPAGSMRRDGVYTGLSNLGATCFVNILLQSLYMNPHLRESLWRFESCKEEVRRRWEGAVAGDRDRMPSAAAGDDCQSLEEHLPYHVLAVFTQLRLSCRSYVSPVSLINALGLSHVEQQDAHEFRTYIMASLESALKSSTYPPHHELLPALFAGSATSVLRCMSCSHTSRTALPFWDIALPIKGRASVYDSLQALVETEELEANAVWCSHCRQKRSMEKRLQYEQLPPYLNLQLMRFELQWTAAGVRKKKIAEKIFIPEKISMRRCLLLQPDQHGQPETQPDQQQQQRDGVKAEQESRSQREAALMAQQDEQQAAIKQGWTLTTGSRRKGVKHETAEDSLPCGHAASSPDDQLLHPPVAAAPVPAVLLRAAASAAPEPDSRARLSPVIGLSEDEEEVTAAASGTRQDSVSAVESEAQAASDSGGPEEKKKRKRRKARPLVPRKKPRQAQQPLPKQEKDDDDAALLEQDSEPAVRPAAPGKRQRGRKKKAAEEAEVSAAAGSSSAQASRYSSEEDESDYHLIAVLLHKGQFANHGHYTATLRDDAGCWWSFDDRAVKRLGANFYDKGGEVVLDGADDGSAAHSPPPAAAADTADKAASAAKEGRSAEDGTEVSDGKEDAEASTAAKVEPDGVVVDVEAEAAAAAADTGEQKRTSGRKRRAPAKPKEAAAPATAAADSSTASSGPQSTAAPKRKRGKQSTGSAREGGGSAEARSKREAERLNGPGGFSKDAYMLLYYNARHHRLQELQQQQEEADHELGLHLHSSAASQHSDVGPNVSMPPAHQPTFSVLLSHHPWASRLFVAKYRREEMEQQNREFEAQRAAYGEKRRQVAAVLEERKREVEDVAAVLQAEEVKLQDVEDDLQLSEDEAVQQLEGDRRSRFISSKWLASFLTGWTEEKKQSGSSSSQPKQAAAATEAETEHGEYEVEEIVSHRERDGAKEYLVKWQGYDAADNTWEAEQSLDKAAALVSSYWESREKDEAGRGKAEAVTIDLSSDDDDGSSDGSGGSKAEKKAESGAAAGEEKKSGGEEDAEQQQLRVEPELVITSAGMDEALRKAMQQLNPGPLSAALDDIRCPLHSHFVSPHQLSSIRRISKEGWDKLVEWDQRNRERLAAAAAPTAPSSPPPPAAAPASAAGDASVSLADEDVIPSSQPMELASDAAASFPSLSLSSLCLICARSLYLGDLQRKLAVEQQRQLQADYTLYRSEHKTASSAPPDAVWVDKTWLQSWRRHLQAVLASSKAAKDAAQQQQLNVKQQELQQVKLGDLTAGLRCAHGELSLDRSQRVYVSRDLWQRMREAGSADSEEISIDADECELCRQQEEEEDEQLKRRSDELKEEKVALRNWTSKSNAFPDPNYPPEASTRHPTRYFLLPAAFHHAVASFIRQRDPDAVRPVLDLSPLLCAPHRQLLYAPRPEGEMIGPVRGTSTGVMVSCDEHVWQQLQRFGYTREGEQGIVMTCRRLTLPGSDSLLSQSWPTLEVETSPPLCDECAMKRQREEEEGKLKFTRETGGGISVITVASEEEARGLTTASAASSAPLLPSFTATAASASSSSSSASGPSSASSRPRRVGTLRHRGVSLLQLLCSSSDSIEQVKMEIMQQQEAGYAPNRQQLWWKGERMDNSRTLEDYAVPRGGELRLLLMAEDDGMEDFTAATAAAGRGGGKGGRGGAERGFSGTALGMHARQAVLGSLAASAPAPAAETTAAADSGDAPLSPLAASASPPPPPAAAARAPADGFLSLQPPPHDSPSRAPVPERLIDLVTPEKLSSNLSFTSSAAEAEDDSYLSPEL